MTFLRWGMCLMNCYKFNKKSLHPLYYLFSMLLSVLVGFGSILYSNVKAPDLAFSISTRLYDISKKSPTGRSYFRCNDNNHIMFYNDYHVERVSNYASNNSIYSDFSDLSFSFSIDGAPLQIDPYLYGITVPDNADFANSPYGMKVIEGNYSPEDPLFNLESANPNVDPTGCLISFSLAKAIIEITGESSLLGKTLTIQNQEEKEANLIITAICDDSILCNDYQKGSSFILSHYITYSKISSSCNLILKLNAPRYTTYEIINYIIKYLTAHPNEPDFVCEDAELNSFIVNYHNMKHDNIITSVVFAFAIIFAISFVSFLRTNKLMKNQYVFWTVLIYFVAFLALTFLCLIVFDDVVFQGIILSMLSYRSIALIIVNMASILLAWILSWIFAFRSRKSLAGIKIRV